jgi:hypothetical protein
VFEGLPFLLFLVSMREHAGKLPYLDYHGPGQRPAGRHRRDRRACGHLVQARLGITGARWGLAGAEAVLRLRAIKANGA